MVRANPPLERDRREAALLGGPSVSTLAISFETMNTRKLKVGNVIVEIPETSSIPLGQPQEAKKVVAERGDEAKPLETLPPIPNPNDFVGSAMFQVHAISRVGTSNKTWVNKAGVLIFGVIPVAFIEVLLIVVWVRNGDWLPFAIANAVLAFILARKDKPAKGGGNG